MALLLRINGNSILSLVNVEKGSSRLAALLLSITRANQSGNERIQRDFDVHVNSSSVVTSKTEDLESSYKRITKKW